MFAAWPDSQCSIILSLTKSLLPTRLFIWSSQMLFIGHSLFIVISIFVTRPFPFYYTLSLFVILILGSLNQSPTFSDYLVISHVISPAYCHPGRNSEMLSYSLVPIKFSFYVFPRLALTLKHRWYFHHFTDVKIEVPSVWVTFLVSRSVTRARVSAQICLASKPSTFLQASVVQIGAWGIYRQETKLSGQAEVRGEQKIGRDTKWLIMVN